jgi:cysteine-rich repeat protein
MIPLCGNGLRDDGEVCDAGSENGTYGACNLVCTGLTAHCGDAIVDAGYETCDDGDDDNADGCSNYCLLPGTVAWTRSFGLEPIDPLGALFDRDDNILAFGTRADGGAEDGVNGGALTLFKSDLAAHALSTSEFPEPRGDAIRGVATLAYGRTLLAAQTEDGPQLFEIDPTGTIHPKALILEVDEINVMASNGTDRVAIGGLLDGDPRVVVLGAGNDVLWTHGMNPWQDHSPPSALAFRDDDVLVARGRLLTALTADGDFRFGSWLGTNDRDGEIRSITASDTHAIFVAGHLTDASGAPLAAVSRIHATLGTNLWTHVRQETDSAWEAATFVRDAVVVAGHHGQSMRLHRYDHAGELVWSLDRDDASGAIAIARSEQDDLVVLGRSADETAGILPWLGVVTP